jgi:hypothetical protein
MSDLARILPDATTAPVAYIVCTPLAGGTARDGEALEFQAVVNDSAIRWGYVPYSEPPASVLLEPGRLSKAEYEHRMNNLDRLGEGAFAAFHISGFTICPYVRELIRRAYVSGTTIFVGYIPTESPLARYLMLFT